MQTNNETNERRGENVGLMGLRFDRWQAAHGPAAGGNILIDICMSCYLVLITPRYGIYGSAYHVSWVLTGWVAGRLGIGGGCPLYLLIGLAGLRRLVGVFSVCLLLRLAAALFSSSRITFGRSILCS
ncbi:hypothetical protein B0H66DRAFT_203371 [Apodospora peruviana]|uniref:Uncharacterized protein n=1 Tax=Apodospora peruviana TaxID=516989 RepID=A0AAE0M7R7_9PEZI|nr:hypothetical protein B0H66DRAFT_203371 [Apodospora peruviana]